MKKIIHSANSRGFADHGWLLSRHTFSFANYYNPDRMGFGKLRVLNDDIVAPGMGFGTHPHDNMEIVSIPITGGLRHKDSMESEQIIKSGEVQCMSAGSGITHSEYNVSASGEVNFLQIWVLPKEHDIEPRYAQRHYDLKAQKNQFLTVVSPDKESKDALWINQDAWFSLATLEEGRTLKYKTHDRQPAVYVFLISGKITIDGETLNERDAMAITDLTAIEIAGNKEADILLIETSL